MPHFGSFSLFHEKIKLGYIVIPCNKECEEDLTDNICQIKFELLHFITFSLYQLFPSAGLFSRAIK